MPLKSGASQLILDNAETVNQPIPIGGAGGVNADGTVWPLLPHQAMRVYNAGVQLTADVPQMVKINSLIVMLQLFGDKEAQFQVGQFPIVAQNYPDPTWVDTSVFSALGEDGDPLIEVVSGIIVTNQAGAVGQTNVAFAKLSALAGCFNSDLVNPHTITIILSALLSFVPRA